MKWTLKHKRWFLAGAVLGFTTACGLLLHFAITRHSFHPIVSLLLWPTSIFKQFAHPSATIGHLILLQLVVGGNALLYGVVAASLRRASVAAFAVLLSAIWVSHPPADDVLRQRFVERKADLEQLVLMSNEDALLVRIAPDYIETADGRTYTAIQSQTLLTEPRWNEYRRLFKTTQMNEGLRRVADTGEVFLFAHTPLGKIGRFGTYYGYLYCFTAPGHYPSYIPCMNYGPNDQEAYRYRRLDHPWYIYEVFLLSLAQQLITHGSPSSSPCLPRPVE